MIESYAVLEEERIKARFVFFKTSHNLEFIAKSKTSKHSIMQAGTAHRQMQSKAAASDGQSS